MITLLNEDCLDFMSRCDDNYIDLTVTSPPYDNLRTYNDSLEWNEDIWKAIIKELYRVTKEGGVVVWVVGDATIKGSETGTSFKQALWAMECGFNLHDTMIWLKDQLAFPDKNRYYNGFEYMFIWSKKSPKTFNQICDKKNKSFGRKVDDYGERKSDGSFRNRSCAGNDIKEFGARWNYWLVYNQQRGEHSKHPATFPEQLAQDHIISWSNEGDLVFDPFMGSGTTGKMAKQLNRNFMGTEKVKEYYDIACKRIETTERQESLF